MTAIFRLLTFFIPKKYLLATIKRVNQSLRAFISQTHKAQMVLEWNIPPEPEWMDHYVDLYHTWGHLGQSSFWVERGVYSFLGLKANGKVLDICCGDGFNSKYFYSPRASHITAVDFDPSAIAQAKKFNQTQNIEFKVADIRTQFPIGQYDNIIWDAAIEHFHEHEMREIFANIKKSLLPGGILSGYTLVEAEHGKGHHLHEREFKSKEDLFGLLKPYFKNVRVFETIHPTRHNLYFYASDYKIPFHKNWEHSIEQSGDETQTSHHFKESAPTL